MSDRARGSRFHHRGGGGGGSHPSFSSSNTGNSRSNDQRPKKEAILDLSKYIDQKIRVKFAGGREVFGILKGYDQLMNLVMDEVEEVLVHSQSQPHQESETKGGEVGVDRKTRSLGLAVLRGTALTVINPVDGFEQIENPFASAE